MQTAGHIVHVVCGHCVLLIYCFIARGIYTVINTPCLMWVSYYTVKMDTLDNYCM